MWAEILAVVGRISDALAAVDKVLQYANESGNSYFNAHLFIVTGDLLQQAGEPASLVSLWYQRAIDFACLQETRSLELRAAIRLGRLWQQQGRAAEAYHLLAPLYGWFTEGFDTPDLIEAKQLLAEVTTAIR